MATLGTEVRGQCREVAFLGGRNVMYMGYWPSVRSRWLDIGQVLFYWPLLRGYFASWDMLLPLWSGGQQ